MLLLLMLLLLLLFKLLLLLKLLLMPKLLLMLKLLYNICRVPGFKPDILRPQTGVLPFSYTHTFILYQLSDVYRQIVRYSGCTYDSNTVYHKQQKL